jgi:hypothetical protein
MKLYTEEQVRTLLNEILVLSSSVEDAMDSLTPIELPSDEDKELFYQKQVMNPYPTEGYAYTAFNKGFVEGARLVINKIQGGNK